MKSPNHVTPSYSFSSPNLWKPNGLVLFLVIGFFGKLPTWRKVCLAFSIHSFEYHVNMFLFMCRLRSRCLVINLSYHICISFILSSFFYNILYPFWLATSHSCPSFTVLVWSYHKQSMYPFILVPLWEWMYSSPRHNLKYCHNYCFEKWSTC